MTTSLNNLSIGSIDVPVPVSIEPAAEASVSAPTPASIQSATEAPALVPVQASNDEAVVPTQSQLVPLWEVTQTLPELQELARYVSKKMCSLVGQLTGLTEPESLNRLRF